MIATAVLAADLAGALDCGDTSSVRARTTTVINAPASQSGTQTPFGVDLVTAPFARLRLASRRTTYTLTYSPTLTLPDIGSGLPLQTFHFGSASIGWRDRATTLTLTEGLAYGELNSAFLYQVPVAPGQTPVLQPAPTTTTIGYVSSNTDLGVGLTAARNIRVSVSGGYAVSGGVDATSRMSLPVQYGPHAGVSFAYSLSRQDSLATSANGADVITSGACPPPNNAQQCHVRSSSIFLQESLSRRLSATARVSAGAGVGVVNTRTDPTDIAATTPGVDQVNVYPDAVAAFSDRFGERGRSEVVASAQVGPVVDARTGFGGERVQINSVLTNLLTSKVTLHAALGLLQSIPTDAPYAVSIVTGSVDAAFRLDRLVTLAIGQQGLWQNQGPYGTLVSVFSFVALTVSAPEMRL